MSPTLDLDASARQLTCPRCNRPNVGSDGRIGSHCVLRADGDTRHRMPRCPGSDRWFENARMRVSPLAVLGLRGKLTPLELRRVRADAVYHSRAIESLVYDDTRGCSSVYTPLVKIRFTGGSRAYTWECGPGGWALLWKCYRITAREHDGRFSLGRAVNRWREMPSIKRAAAERIRQDLATDSPDLVANLKASLRAGDIFKLEAVPDLDEETVAGEND